MNNFIRQSNKALLIAIIGVSFGAWMSQINRARAVTMVDCPYVKGTIGTGAGCATVYYEPNGYTCQIGTTTTGLSACCKYERMKYYCVNGSTSTSLGTKEYLRAATVGYKCLYADEMSDTCAGPPGT